MVDLVSEHRSTIVFANSRRLAERLTARLNEIATERAAGLGGAEDDDGDAAAADGTGRRATQERGWLGEGPPAQAPGASGLSAGAPVVIAKAHHG